MCPYEMNVRKNGNSIKVVTEEHELTFSLGNKKLSRDILIFNLPAGKGGSCPMTCRKCYALKAQRLYPSARRARWLNFEAMQDEPLILFHAIRAIYHKYGHLISAFRLHESGDMFSTDYARVIEIVASWLSRRNVRSYTYTKSIYRPAFINIVESILPDGDVNYGNLDYLTKKADKFNIRTCPATLPDGHDVVCGRDCTMCQHAKHVLFLEH